MEYEGEAAQTDTAPKSKTGAQLKTDSKTAPNSSKDNGVQLEVDVQQSVAMIKKRISPKTSVFGLGQVDFVRSQSLLLQEGITQIRSPTRTDESSEEQLDDDIEREEPEERWESSPGFDVLVDNKSDDLDYENDSEYPLDPEGEQRGYFSYDSEDSIQHDTRYPDVEFPYDQDAYDVYEGSDNEYIFDNVRNPSDQPRDRRLGSIFSQERRRLLPVQLSIDVDLRDYLSERRVVEGNPLKCLSRPEYPHLINRSLERLQRHSMGWKSSGKLASTVGKHSIKLTEAKRKSKDASTAFTGPKTLAQIREEKRKTEENGGKPRHSIGTASADFQDPKPLSEILKGKERLAKSQTYMTMKCRSLSISPRKEDNPEIGKSFSAAEVSKMEEITQGVNNINLANDSHKKNRIQVSNTKKPLFFYVNLANVSLTSLFASPSPLFSLPPGSELSASSVGFFVGNLGVFSAVHGTGREKSRVLQGESTEITGPGSCRAACGGPARLHAGYLGVFLTNKSNNAWMSYECVYKRLLGLRQCESLGLRQFTITEAVRA
ncbi:Detected protein of unknown function [Hibiscus syriacus]|uniref:Uncharacterized protein n=1 Tax=Hibiscus syriacus TaxID=106335 RepID=A0A6A3B3F9_HIBSY|nr:Detected protein of unknown function [Hibiscus syriacus]